jgi:hypothetical protein
MASVGPTPCSGLKSDIASPIPKAHFETVLNMSPDAFGLPRPRPQRVPQLLR